MSATGRLLRRFVAVTFAVFLHLAPEISSYQKIRNRFFRQWDVQDAVALALDVLLLGLLVTAAVQLLDRPRWPRVRAALRASFVLMLVSGVVANLPMLHRPRFLFFELMWLGIAGIAGYCYARPECGLVRIAHRGALLFSPLAPILIAQMFTWSTWSSTPRPAPAPGLDGAGRPVFVFILDEWSFAHAAPDGEFRAEYPHLRSLAGQALSFRAARSPGEDTYRALPLLIYGDHPLEDLPRVFARRDRDGREFVTGAVPPRPVEGIFEMARAARYHTALIGFYLPYQRMFSDSLDFVRGYPYYPIARSLWDRMGLHALEALRHETDPLSRNLFRKAYAAKTTAYWLWLRDRLEEDVATIIDRMPANTVTFIHYPLPHAPFVFNPDGSFRGVYPVNLNLRNDDQDRMAGTVEDYRRHLAYLDRWIGERMEQLRAAGRYDDALIVLTSDHAWRLAPEAVRGSQARRWVPLLIKLPGQREGRVVDQPFDNVRYQGFVRKLLLGDSRDPSVDSLWAGLGRAAP